jgi:dipeptidyl aminopeptidase/acylaminoacyl peptidase
VNIKNLQQVDLTPTEGVRASVLKLSNKFPSKMLINLNDRVPEYFDIYKVDINTGDRELLYKNTENYSHFIADDNFNIRVGYKMLPSGESEIYLFENGDTSKPKLFQKISVEYMLTTNPLHISADGTKLFMIDSTDRNSSALIEADLQSAERKMIHSDVRADYLVDTKTKMVQGVAVEYLRKEWTILDKKISADIAYLSSLEDGDVEVVSSLMKMINGL